jgi:hypothetical protein
MTAIQTYASRLTACAALILIMFPLESARAQIACGEVRSVIGQELLPPECPFTSPVSGSVLGVDLSSGSIHVSLSPLCYGSFFEVTVDSSGGFEIASVPQGKYDLMVSQGGRILGFETVTVASGHSQLILQVGHVRKLAVPGRSLNREFANKVSLVPPRNQI